MADTKQGKAEGGSAGTTGDKETTSTEQQKKSDPDENRYQYSMADSVTEWKKDDNDTKSWIAYSVFALAVIFTLCICYAFALGTAKMHTGYEESAKIAAREVEKIKSAWVREAVQHAAKERDESIKAATQNAATAIAVTAKAKASDASSSAPSNITSIDAAISTATEAYSAEAFNRIARKIETTLPSKIDPNNAALPTSDADAIESGIHSEDAFNSFIEIGILILAALIAALTIIFLTLSKKVLEKKYPIYGSKDQGHNIQFILRSINNLERSTILHYCIGVFASFVALFTVCVIAKIVMHLFESSTGSVFRIAESLAQFLPHEQDKKEVLNVWWPYVTALLALILRTSMLAGFAALIATKSIGFAMRSFDQAARFTKRRHSAYFLMQMVINQKEFDIDNLQKIMGSFMIWNSSVDSAYTERKSGDDQSDISDIFKNPFASDTDKNPALTPEEIEKIRAVFGSAALKHAGRRHHPARSSHPRPAA